MQNLIRGPQEAYAQARLLSINQVLGTDMKKHFDITSRFQVCEGSVVPILMHLLAHTATL